MWTNYVGVYKHLHAHPELSAQEYQTAEYIERHLAGLGIESFRCGGTGVVGILKNGDGPVIGFRADTDGLPIAEQTGLDYASEATGTLPDGSTAPGDARLRPRHPHRRRPGAGVAPHGTQRAVGRNRWC